MTTPKVSLSLTLLITSFIITPVVWCEDTSPEDSSFPRCLGQVYEDMFSSARSKECLIDRIAVQEDLPCEEGVIVREGERVYVLPFSYYDDPVGDEKVQIKGASLWCKLYQAYETVTDICEPVGAAIKERAEKFFPVYSSSPDLVDRASMGRWCDHWKRQ